MMRQAIPAGPYCMELPRAGLTGGMPLRVMDFVGTAERLAWAKANGCEWSGRTCAYAAGGG